MELRTAVHNLGGFLLTLAFILTLSGCAVGPPPLTPASAGEAATPGVAKPTSVLSTTNGTANVASTLVPTPSASAPSVTATAGAVANQTSGATPTVLGTAASDPTGRAIQAVILSADLEQIAAFTRGDPTAMQDTSTGSYYTELVKGNQALTSAGAKSLQLLQLTWGPLSLQSGTGAQATTYESWLTTYTDDQTELQESDLNIYTLMLVNGSWKIQSDAHPNDQLTPVAASGRIGRRPTPGPATTPAPIVSISTSDQSHNWSGFSAAEGTFTSVTGSWIVPHINAAQTTGTTSAGDATWVGIGGVSGHDLIQSGTEAQVVGPGDTVYDAWIELLPAPSKTVPLVVVPGDSVTVTITETRAGTWSMTLQNNATGQKYQTSVQYQSSNSSAEWIEEAPTGRGHVESLDNFGVVKFSADSTVKDGKMVTISGAGAQSIDMAGSNGQPLAVPSQLSSDGSSFIVTRS